MIQTHLIWSGLVKVTSYTYSNYRAFLMSEIIFTVFSMTKSDHVSFIKLYHHIVVIQLLDSKVFNVCFWQTSCTLSKSKWSYTVLFAQALSNLYLHFFLAHPDFFDRSKRSFIPVNCQTNLQLFSTNPNFSLVAQSFQSRYKRYWKSTWLIFR